jgi:hypothetical protein
VVQGADAHTAELRAQPVIESKQVSGDVGDQQLAFSAGLLLQLGDLGRRGVAGLELLGPAGLDLEELPSQRIQLGLSRLEPLHHGELLVLEVADPAMERLDLVLHRLELLGITDQSAVDALLVAGTPGLDLLDVRVGLPLFAGQVLDLGLGAAVAGAHVGAPLGQGGQRGLLGERLESMLELIQARVDELQIEQLQLGERVSFQGWLLGSAIAGWAAGMVGGLSSSAGGEGSWPMTLPAR